MIVLIRKDFEVCHASYYISQSPEESPLVPTSEVSLSSMPAVRTIHGGEWLDDRDATVPFFDLDPLVVTPGFVIAVYHGGGRVYHHPHFDRIVGSSVLADDISDSVGLGASCGKR